MTVAKLVPTARTSCVVTPTQRIALDADRNDPTNRLLLTRHHFLLEGPIDAEALRATLEEIVARHSVLGSRFVQDGSTIVNHVADRRHTIALERVSFEDTPADRQDARWDELAVELVRPFDLETGPLIRAALVKLGPDRHVLACTIHHIAFDRSSVTPFMAELKAGYQAYTANADWPLPPLRYIDFAAYLDELSRSPAGIKQHAYWKGLLENAKPLELPIDRARDALDAQRDAAVRGMLFRPIGLELVVEVVEGALYAELVQLARAEKTSNFIIMVAALATILQRTRNQTHITIQSNSNLRTKPSLMNLIGRVGNSIILRFDMTGNPTYRELIARVRNATLTSWSNAEAEVIGNAPHGVRRLNVNYFRGGEGSFGRQEPFAPGVTIAHLDLRKSLDPSKVTLPTDIQWWMHDGTDRCRMRVAYYRELFDASTIRDLVRGMIVALEEMCRDPDRRLA